MRVSVASNRPCSWYCMRVYWPAIAVMLTAFPAICSTEAPARQSHTAPHDYRVAAVRWSPAGSSLAALRVALKPGVILPSGDLFARGPSADEWNGLWVFAETGDRARRVREGLLGDYGWAADGTLIVGNEEMLNGEPGARWLVVDLNGAMLREVAPATQFVTEYAVSPDGRFLAYLGSQIGSARESERSLFVLDCATWQVVGQPTHVTVGGLLWAPNGRSVYCGLGAGPASVRLAAPTFVAERSRANLRFPSHQAAVDNAGRVVFADGTALYLTSWGSGKSRPIKRGDIYAPVFSNLGALAYGDRSDRNAAVLWTGVLKDGILLARRRDRYHPVDFAVPIGWSLDGKNLACCDKDGSLRVVND